MPHAADDVCVVVDWVLWVVIVGSSVAFGVFFASRYKPPLRSRYRDAAICLAVMLPLLAGWTWLLGMSSVMFVGQATWLLTFVVLVFLWRPSFRRGKRRHATSPRDE